MSSQDTYWDSDHEPLAALAALSRRTAARPRPNKSGAEGPSTANLKSRVSENIVRCPGCKVELTRWHVDKREAVAAHFLRDHHRILGLSKPMTDNGCPICGLHCTDQSELVVHINGSHAGDRPPA